MNLIPANPTRTMANQFLPPGHKIETVRPGSRFVGARDYTTHRPIEAGHVVVVCGRVNNPAVTSVEAWSEAIETCYNCGARNPGYGAPVPAPYTKTAAASTVVMGPGTGTRRPQGNGPTPLFALLAAVALLMIVGLLFVTLGNGGASGDPTPRPPATGVEQAGIVSITIPPTAIPPTPFPPTAAPPTVVPPTAAPPTTAPPTAMPPTAPPPTVRIRPLSPISELVLVDATSDLALLALTDGSVISLSQLGARHLTILANAGATPVGSVRFLLDGREFCLNDRCVENSPPYSMAGDLGGDHYNNWDWSSLLGTHTITAIPYTVAGAAGEELPALTVQLTITK